MEKRLEVIVEEIKEKEGMKVDWRRYRTVLQREREERENNDSNGKRKRHREEV